MTDPETGKIAAADIVGMAQKITNFGQLYIWLKASKHGTRDATGIVVQLNMYDAQRTQLVVNSNLIFETLMAEFNNIGRELEGNNIDTGALIAGIEEQFKQLYATGT